jgi:HNH endonuclease
VRNRVLPALPLHPPMQYAPAGECIYCGSTKKLTTEHTIPYALGGAWVQPKASCTDCAKITATFEGQFCRTMLGPLRMLYDMPTRRPKDRPRHLALKVKYPTAPIGRWHTLIVTCALS